MSEGECKKGDLYKDLVVILLCWFGFGRNVRDRNSIWTAVRYEPGDEDHG